MSDTPPTGSPESTPPNPPVNPQGGPTPEYAAPGVPVAPDPADVEKNKVMAILAYVGFLVLVPILAAKESPFAKYHANQGLVLCLGGIAVAIVSGILSLIPFVGFCAVCGLFPALSIAWLVFAILGILNAVNGQMKPLPLFPSITLIK
jgi:uncharacterized membrane protein